MIAGAAEATSDFLLVSYNVRLNRSDLGTWALLQKGTAFYVKLTDLPAWGVRPPSNSVVIRERNQLWLPMSGIPGLEMRVSKADSRIDMVVPEAALLRVLPPLDPGAATSDVERALVGNAARFLPVDVTINGSRTGNWLILEQAGAFYATEDALREWRVTRNAQAKPLNVRGERWYPLSSIAGFEAQFDQPNQALNLKFSSQAFSATQLATGSVSRPAVSPSVPAAFLNYDANLTTTSARDQASTRNLGAVVELGVSNDWGVLTSSHVATGLMSADARWRRLETTFTRDLPQDKLSFRLGDSSTRLVNGGRQVYFGGVQLGRNFSLSPGFTTQPIPIVAGLSTTPSTVELYINDTLRQTSRVPAGPFTVENAPQLNGSGQARVVVRDLLGRETVIVQDFYTSTDLLAPGLDDWSVEAGAVRRNLGQESASYGERFVSGMYRAGVSPTRTVQAKAEAGEDTQGLRLAMTQTLSSRVLGDFGIAASRNRVSGSGWQATMGLEHRSLRHGFSLRIEKASDGFSQVGLQNNLQPKLTAAAAYNYLHPTLGSFGVAMARNISAADVTLDSYTLSYGVRVFDSASLSVNLTRAVGSSTGTAVNVYFSMPLGSRGMSFAASASASGGHVDGYGSLIVPLNQETGVGGRAVAGTRTGEAFSEGGLYYQGSKGYVSADLSASRQTQSMRLGAQGGLAVAEGKFFASRRIDDSFAIVEVPGYADIGIGFGGGSLTRTDADGIAVLPRLRAYDINSIQLDPRQLPISAELDTIEQVTVPAARSAVKVTFPVRTGRGALLKLVLDNGDPVPAGADIELVGDTKEFFVARRGEAFVTGLQARNQIRVKFNGQQCAIDVELPPAEKDEISRIGPLRCAGVKP